MGKCDNCRLRKESARAFDIHWHGEDDCPYEKCPVPDLPMTNADRIRAMTDEELAERLAILTDCVNCPCRDPHDQCDTADGSCKKQWLDWLKKEVEDDL